MIFKEWQNKLLRKHDDLAQVLNDTDINSQDYSIEYRRYDKFETPIWLICKLRCKETSKPFSTYKAFKKHIDNLNNNDK